MRLMRNWHQQDIQAQHGLVQLVPNTAAPAPERNIDIVFVHGLGGDCLKTWTNPGQEAPWIGDPAFLGELYESARIMSFGYPSSVFHNVTTDRIINHANDLLEGLWTRRNKCKALILCHDEDRYKDIQEMTRSVIFMGTPHEGSDEAKHLEVAQKIVSLVRGGQDATNLTRELERYSASTMDINKSFMKKASRGLTLLCFFETLPTRLPQGERMV
ncbi:hypothetical protein IL306_004460 [Fusarium sp. DS 682]|nr:hypothetical protein IL306_004460 [Fusarium sp. DS 682]